MTFKPKQLDPKTVQVFSETEVGALVENIDEKLGLILENQQGMKADIKAITHNSKNLSNRIERAEVRLDVIESQ